MCHGNAALTLNSINIHIGDHETLILGQLVNIHGVEPDPLNITEVTNFPLYARDENFEDSWI